MVNNKKNKTRKQLPFVSVCTPTFNRRPFIQNMFQCFRNQTYPMERIEWIIVDDGSDKIKDLIDESKIKNIKYYPIEGPKMTLGSKRNLMHKYCSGGDDSIIVYMDDDDYYPPERIQHAVDMLKKTPSALCAGSSEIYIFFNHIKKMMQAGPYGPNHATAGTFAFWKKLLKDHKYNEDASLAEEKAFLKNYTVPFVQLDPLKTILVVSHDQNTFDKKKMLNKQHQKFFKESDKTVDMFIRNKNEDGIKKFFTNDIITTLDTYNPGRPENKPDVLAQMKVIEKEREEMQKEMQKKQMENMPKIRIERPGQEPQLLSIEQAVNILTQQHKLIDNLILRNKEMKTKLDMCSCGCSDNNSIPSLQPHIIPSTPPAMYKPFDIMPSKPIVTTPPSPLSQTMNFNGIFVV